MAQRTFIAVDADGSRAKRAAFQFPRTWGEMMKTVICTVGTSIANSTPALRALQQEDTAWGDPTPELEVQIGERLTGFDLGTDAGRSRASAELNSLNRLRLGANDGVILLATDTADGRTCAQAVESVLTGSFGLSQDKVKVVRVPGMQVRDADKLRKTGLPALIERVIAFVEDPQLRYGGEIVLNPTGGFKGVVPFITVIGMLFGLRSVYIFEHAESLISLPPLPVSFDMHLYERARPALQQILAEGVINEDAFFSAIEGFDESERSLFGGFVEHENGMVTLSTLAQVLVSMDTGRECRIMLHPEVLAKFNAAGSFYQCEMARYLGRVSFATWRSGNIHRFYGTRLKIYGNQRQPRIAGFPVGDVFYVTSYHHVEREQHDDYYGYVTGKGPDDFDTTEFVAWQATGDLVDTNADLKDAEITLVEQLQCRVRDLEIQLQSVERPLRQQINELRAQASQTKRNSKRKNRNRDMRHEGNTLRAKLVALQEPEQEERSLVACDESEQAP